METTLFSRVLVESTRLINRNALTVRAELIAPLLAYAALKEGFPWLSFGAFDHANFS